MSEIVHAGFESPTLSFIRDLTINELIDKIVTMLMYMLKRSKRLRCLK